MTQNTKKSRRRALHERFKIWVMFWVHWFRIAAKSYQKQPYRNQQNFFNPIKMCLESGLSSKQQFLKELVKISISAVCLHLPTNLLLFVHQHAQYLLIHIAWFSVDVGREPCLNAVCDILKTMPQDIALQQ